MADKIIIYGDGNMARPVMFQVSDIENDGLLIVQIRLQPSGGGDGG